MTPQSGLSGNYTNSKTGVEAGQNISLEIREFIRQKFPLARKRQVQDADALLESGMLDSQGVLEVVSFVEKQFSIVVDDDDLVPANFQTIEQIAAFVRGKMAGTA